MAHYRIYLLDQHRRIISAANVHCADEHEARERAQHLVDCNDVELWQLDRRVAVFEARHQQIEAPTVSKPAADLS